MIRFKFYLLIFLFAMTLNGCGSAADQSLLRHESPSKSALSLPATSSVDIGANYNRLYGYIYWQNGLPTSKLKRYSNSWSEPAMAANPDLIVQTGYYNMRFDLDDVDITGLDASEGSDYMAALNEDVESFSDADLQIKVYKNGVAYHAKKALVEDNGLTVRLIEGGQYLQRFDHTGLVFVDSKGNTLDENGYFEVSAWPDRVVLTLDFSGYKEIERIVMQVTAPNGVAHHVDSQTNKANLAFQPHDNKDLSVVPAQQYITQVVHKASGQEMDVSFDPDVYAVRMDLVPSKITYPSDKDVFDEYVFTVRNTDDSPQNIPLVFNQTSVPTITGTVMTLVEDDDGRPTGHAVQISKNWHKDKDRKKRTKHQGSWLRGSTVISLPAKSARTLRLRVIYGYWGGVAAASHAQLSLIGYGDTCWQWDESALGAWGESMTFDPYQAIAGAFIADVRPTFTSPMNTRTHHSWTENYGGGNFLVYYDKDGRHRWLKALKTAYRWTGPNMTEVLYSGVTDDDAIRFTFTSQLVRSNDLHRRFQHYEYEFLKNVSPSRLAFYQMGADYYDLASFEHFYWGNADKLLAAKKENAGGNKYTNNIPFTDNWLATDDYKAGGKVAHANQGLLWRSSQTNGVDDTLNLHTYGRTWRRDTTLFEIAGSDVKQTYRKGTHVKGELEFIMPAESISKYWGNDKETRSLLSAVDKGEPWRLVQLEQAYNTFVPIVKKGVLIKDYPITIIPEEGEELTEFSVPANKGLGHIPVIIKSAPVGLVLRAQYKMEGSDEWKWAMEDVKYLTENAFYQGYLNADRTMDYVLNIAKPVGQLGKRMTIRVFAKG